MKSHQHQNSRRTSMSNVLLKRTSVSSTARDRWSKLRQHLLGLVHPETTSDRWSKIPADALGLVVDRIVDEKDFIVFRSVCKDWRSAIPQSYWKRTPWLLARICKTPVLVLKGLSSISPGKISLRSLLETELCWRYWGSFTGWILGQQTSDLRLKLINPVTKAVIDLPQLNHLIRKGLIYQTPGSDSRNPAVGVMVIFQSLNGIAMIDNEFKDWTFLADMEGDKAMIDNEFKDWTFLADMKADNKSDFVDLVWYKDNLVALRANGAIVFFNESTVVRSLDPKPNQVKNCFEIYLVESLGDLLIILAHLEWHRFNVYRLNLDTGDWIQVTDLGRHSIFVGNSYSMSCWISDDEPTDSWRPSCIYNSTYSSTSSGKLSCYNITNKTEEVHDLGPVTDLDKCFDFVWYMPAVGFN
ncbi:hypothetical protein POM88_023259 [Heracleum sosnowskyi]|uniref:KIB1-4 beta-propeller domain-containing protein n=1 Tax=Heracleum sosnowskyi TaxID=360622 RepID=A0AAD8IGQ0_9APIA|nr:hypothetical protein POM88_023259 [Heracleum sosnowskyi]